MSQLNKLYRNFIILQEDERGYSISNDKTLSGYSKIEAKGEKCKISFYAQNLRSDSDDYCVLAVCSKKDTKQLVNLGKLTISDGGKAEVIKEYFLDDVGGVGLSFDKITGAAIAKMRNEIPLIVMCGFVNGEQPTDNWKNYKVVKASNNKPREKVEFLKRDDRKKDKKEKEKEKDCPKEKEKIEEKIKYMHKEENHNCDVEEDKIKHMHKEEKHHCDENDDKMKHIHEKKNISCKMNESIFIEDLVEEKKYNKEYFKEKESNGNPFGENIYDSNPFGSRETKTDFSKKYNKFDEYESKIEELSGNFKIRGSVGEYFEGIANGFEALSNEYREIKNCKWYRVPVKDLDDLCNMANYNRYTVAYYPMLNYYPYIRKHGYFNLGYKCDREGNLKYIVYGIPGNRSLDEQPYEGKTGFVTWINREDRNSMGCWLMFYDFRNSTVVVPME